MSNLHEIWVIDDMRELPDQLGCAIKHFKTDAEFVEFVKGYANDTHRWRSDSVDVIIDHDAGGMAFGEDTFRGAVKVLCDLYKEHKLPKLFAFVVTLNPAGGRWIGDMLADAGIDYDIDPGGRELGMNVPPGW